MSVGRNKGYRSENDQISAGEQSATKAQLCRVGKVATVDCNNTLREPIAVRADEATILAEAKAGRKHVFNKGFGKRSFECHGIPVFKFGKEMRRFSTIKLH